MYFSYDCSLGKGVCEGWGLGAGLRDWVGDIIYNDGWGGSENLKMLLKNMSGGLI